MGKQAKINEIQKHIAAKQAATLYIQGIPVASTIDAEARTAINTLLARVRTYGLIAT